MAKLILILAFLRHWLLVYGAHTTSSPNCDGNETTLPCDEYEALRRVLSSLNHPSYYEISPSLDEISPSYCGNSSSLEPSAEIRCNCSIKDNQGKNICHITQIDLRGFAIVPYFHSIDEAISGLQHLQNLSVSNYRLKGILPKSLGNLTSLQKLDLSSNDLEGPITTLSSLKNLMYLDLSSNFFNQDIPPSFGSFPLRHLDLRRNMFSGSIPNELGNLTYLEELYI